MATADVIRKVQRQIGDDNEILISKADIVDYINEAQVEIARETLYRSTSDTDTAANFRTGKTVTDMILLQRIYYGTKPLAILDVETLDRMDLSENPEDVPQAYYRKGPQIFLWPTPLSTDTTTVTFFYVNEPTDLADENDNLDIDSTYEEDLTNFCKARANERNENFAAARHFRELFDRGIAQRKYEAQSQDDTFHTVGPDYADYEGYDYI